MKQKSIFLFTFYILFLSGCLQTSILDDILLGTVLGFDYVEENKIRVTGLSPVFMKDQPVKNVIHTSLLTNERQAIDILQREANQPIKLGSLMIALYSKELAEKKEFIDHVKFLKRDPYIGSRLYIAIVDGKANQLLKNTYGEDGNGIFLSKLLKHNMEERDLPESNLHLFLFDYFQSGKDPSIPVLKVVSSDEVKINGVAILSTDKVTHIVPPEKLFFLKLLVDKHTKGTINLQTDKESIVFENIKSKTKMKLFQRNPYVINIKLSIEGTLQYFTDGKLNKKRIEKVEELLREKIKKETLKLTKQFQELRVDPVGIGAFVKSQTRDFDFNKWDDIYPNIAINIETEIVIIDTGTIK